MPFNYWRSHCNLYVRLERHLVPGEVGGGVLEAFVLGVRFVEHYVYVCVCV